MAETYKGADKVLALIPELLYVGNDPFERIARVASCSWLRRLWTLQEAVLAKELVFRFAESIVTYKELVIAVWGGNPSEVSPPLSGSFLLSMLTPLVGLGYLNDANRRERRFIADELIAFVSFLATRLTSKKEDEPICIATLLGISLDGILGAYPSNRMRELYKSMEYIPVGLLFTPGPRINRLGYKWAPRSLLSQDSDFVGQGVHSVGHAPGYLGKWGLLITMPGLVLRHSQCPVGQPLPVVFLQRGTTQPHAYYMLEECSSYIENSSNIIERFQEINNAAVILSGVSSDNDIGVLVRICNEKTAYISCAISVEYRCRGKKSKRTRRWSGMSAAETKNFAGSPYKRRETMAGWIEIFIHCVEGSLYTFCSKSTST
jgi:hypothetical protein